MPKIRIQIPDGLESIAPNYLRKRILDLEVLKDALNRKDLESVANLAHKTKGTAASYGFTELGELAKSLEIAAKSENSVEADATWKKMKIYLESVEIL